MTPLAPLIVGHLKSLGVTIRAEAGKLKLSHALGLLTDDDKAFLKENRAELVAFLSEIPTGSTATIEAVDRLRENNRAVSEFYSAYREAEVRLQHSPGLVKIVLRDGCGRDRELPNGARVQFDRFEDFCAADPPEDLGFDVPFIRSL